MARVTVANSFRQMRNVRLTPEAFDLLKNGQNDRFHERFGDTYVRGMCDAPTKLDNLV